MLIYILSLDHINHEGSVFYTFFFGATLKPIKAKGLTI